MQPVAVTYVFIVDGRRTTLKCLEDIPLCPSLTYLCFIYVNKGLDASLIGRLHDAAKKGNLPSLTHLSFQNCGWKYDYSCSVVNLLQSLRSTLTYLDLSGYCLGSCESHVMKITVLPDLQTFVVPAHCVTGENTINFPSFRSLFIKGIAEKDEEDFLFVLGKGKLLDLKEVGLSLTKYRSTVIGLEVISKFIPKLESLTLNYFCICIHRPVDYVFLSQLSGINLSHSKGLTGNFHLLLSCVFPKLETIVLRNCGLVAEDLQSLAYAKVRGSLPILRHLNVSMNPECAGYLECLFDASRKWKELLSLNIEQRYVDEKYEKISLFSQDSGLIMSKVESGCLSSLEEFSFTIYSPQYFTKTVSKRWEHLKKINISLSLSNPFSWKNIDFTRAQVGDNAYHPVLQPLYNMVRKNLLPLFKIFPFFCHSCPRAVISMLLTNISFQKQYLFAFFSESFSFAIKGSTKGNHRKEDCDRYQNGKLFLLVHLFSTFRFTLSYCFE